MSKNSADKDFFDESYAKKIISIISLSALMGIGIWMIAAPGGLEHSSVEKGSVYIMKEIWSFEAGLIMLAISVPFVILTLFRVLAMSKRAWYREDSGYFLFINKQRSSGNPSFYVGNDLMVFHQDSGNVYQLKNYQKAKHNKLFPATISKEFDTESAYWRADKSGFYLYSRGERLQNLTSKYDGDDLYVKSPDDRKSFKLPNYRNLLDNKIRKAESLN
jgi:hypothetical protein